MSWLPRDTPFQIALADKITRDANQICFHENYDTRVMACGGRHQVCIDCGSVPSAMTEKCRYE